MAADAWSEAALESDRLSLNTWSTACWPPIFKPPEPWNLRIIQGPTADRGVTLDSWGSHGTERRVEGLPIKTMKFGRQLGGADANGAIGQNWRGGKRQNPLSVLSYRLGGENSLALLGVLS